MLFDPWKSFFFSSRRRHTRCLSDWSSDVCSSDLEINVGARLEDHELELAKRPYLACDFDFTRDDEHCAFDMLGRNLQPRAGLEHDVDIHQVRIDRHWGALPESFTRDDGKQNTVGHQPRQRAFGMMGKTRPHLRVAFEEVSRLLVVPDVAFKLQRARLLPCRSHKLWYQRCELVHLIDGNGEHPVHLFAPHPCLHGTVPHGSHAMTIGALPNAVLDRSPIE